MKNPGRNQWEEGGWWRVRCWENDGEAAAQATRCTRGEIGLIGTFGPRLVTYLLNWRAGRLVGWSVGWLGCVGVGEERGGWRGSAVEFVSGSEFRVHLCGGKRKKKTEQRLISIKH